MHRPEVLNHKHGWLSEFAPTLLGEDGSYLVQVQLRMCSVRGPTLGVQTQSLSEFVLVLPEQAGSKVSIFYSCCWKEEISVKHKWGMNEKGEQLSERIKT